MRIVGAGDHQLGDIHHLRFQLHQALYRKGLAIIRRFFCFPDCPVHGNVRLSIDYLSVVRVVEQSPAGSELAGARIRTLARSTSSA